MPDINAQFPLKGIHEGVAYTGQPPATTREAVNVQAADPVSGRTRGGQRCGLQLHNTSQLNGSDKVSDLSHVVYDSSKTSWALEGAVLNSAEWQKTTPSGTDCADIALDRQNNSYVTDGLASICKYNSAGNLVYTLAVPVVDSLHEVKSLAVDESDFIFCGVSSGGAQGTAKLFAYEQIEASTNNRIWDITVGMYAKRIVTKNGLLYVGFDDTSAQRSYVHVYDSIQSGVPLLRTSWEAPYPINDLCLSGKDQGVVTAHEPNAQRGTSPTSPGTTATSIDWRPTDLPDFTKRVWCWLDATDVDGDGSNNELYENGEEVLTWYDKSGNNRHLYRNIDAINATSGIADAGPSLLKKSVAGRDALAFNGVNNSMVSGYAITAVSNATTQQLRSQNLTLWPSEAGAQFAMFVVVRASQEEVVRVLFSQDELATHNYNTCRALMFNRNPANTALFTTSAAGAYTTAYGPASMLGNICWAEQTGTGPASGGGAWTASSIQPSGTRESASPITAGSVSNTVGFRPAAGSSISDYTLITLIQNGGSTTNAGDSFGNFESKMYINGTLCDRWNSKSSLSSLFPVYVGWSKATPGAGLEYRFRGLLCEVLVLSDWYEAPSSPFETSRRRYPVTSTPDGVSSPWASMVPMGGSFNGLSYYNQATSTEKSCIGWEAKVIEGYLAHKWGMAHLLASGQRASLNVSSRGTAPSATQTVTIDNTANNATATKIYTYRATVSTGANDVLIGSSCYTALLNLYYAINASSKSGISYGSSTVQAASLVAYPPIGLQTAAGSANAQYYLQLGTKSNLLTEGVGYLEGFNDTAANHSWTQPTTNVYYTSINNEGSPTPVATAWLQHPFYLYRPFSANHNVNGVVVSNTLSYGSILGGPPRSDGKRLPNPYQCMSNPNGLICKWDGSTGKLKWFAGSRADGDYQATYGGVGYGIVSNYNGLLCSVGPKQTQLLMSPPQYQGSGASGSGTQAEVQGGVFAENVTVRTVLDLGDSFGVANSQAWKKFTEPTEVDYSFEEPNYKYPRLASDAFGNFYVPWQDTEGNASRYALYVMTYKDTTTLGGTDPVLHRYMAYDGVVPYAASGLSVACTQVKPDYTPHITEANSQAEYAVLGLRNENVIVLTVGASNPTDGSKISIQYNGQSVEYTFKNTPAAADDVKIVSGDPAATLANLARCISGTGTSGTDYFGGSTIHPSVGAKTIYNSGFTACQSVVLQVKSPVAKNSSTTAIQATESTATLNFTIGSATTYDANIRRIKMVNATPTTGSTRQFKTIGVSGGALFEFDDTSVVTPVTGSAFKSDASDYYQSAVLFQKVYITNGQEVLVYNPRTGAAEELKSTTSGEVPKRCKLIASWRARLVLARASDSPHNWFMSAIGEPTNWDLFPRVVNAGQAIAGTISKAGLVPDVINTLVPYNDDLLMIGGDHSIYRLTGDPMAGGQMDLVTDVTGMAFGQSWDKDPQGNLYFVSPRGQLYVMSPGKAGMRELSNGRFEQRLGAIDLTNNYIKVVWNDLERTLHIFVMPYGAGGTHLAHFRYERDQDAFWQDEFGTTAITDVQPTAALVIDADAPGDRALLIGGEDGRVRKWSKDVRNDQRTTSTSHPIDSQVVMGPYGAPDAEVRLSKIQAVMASDQQRANIQIFASDSPDTMGNMLWSGTLMPGRNPNIFARAKGSFFWIRLRNAFPDERWSFESMQLTVAKAGRKRVRP